MGIAATLCRRTAAAIEEDDLHPVFRTRCGWDSRLAGPIRAEVPAILGAVAKSQYHMVDIAPGRHVGTVVSMDSKRRICLELQPDHHRLKQRDNHGHRLVSMGRTPKANKRTTSAARGSC